MVSKIDLSKPLMPKATAIWLIENTALTFGQIARFCDLHEFEVESIANKPSVIGKSPIKEGLLTQEEIDRCQDDPKADLKSLKRNDIPAPRTRSKGPRYTPVSKRGDKPDAIAYILKFHTEITDAQITKLIGTTKNTIAKIRDKSHLNIQNIRPRHPAEIGLCTYDELEQASRKGFKAQGKDPDEARQKVMDNQAEQKPEDTATQTGSGFDFSNFLGTPAGEAPSVSSDDLQPQTSPPSSSAPLDDASDFTSDLSDNLDNEKTDEL